MDKDLNDELFMYFMAINFKCFKIRDIEDDPRRDIALKILERAHNAMSELDLGRFSYIERSEIQQLVYTMDDMVEPLVAKGKKFVTSKSRNGRVDALGKLTENVFLDLMARFPGKRLTARDVFDAIPEGKQQGIIIQEKEYDEYDGLPLAIYWRVNAKDKRTKFHSSFEDRVRKIKAKHYPD